MGVALMLGGCGTSPSTATTVDAGFAAMIEDLIGQAESAGATAEQLAVLDIARTEGAVSLSLLSEAVDATLACFESASIAHTSSTDESQPLPLITYTYGSGEAGNPVAESCIVENSYFVEAAYQNQPRWQAVLDERIENNRDAILQCLRDLGIDIDDAATPDEITQATHISTEELHEYLDAGSQVPVDCLVQFGAN